MSRTTDPLARAAKGDEDYILARAALRRRTLTSGAAFHEQQCAEKYLKAALLARGYAFPKTHDLLALSGLCAQAGLVVPVDAARLNELSDHAVFTRYRGASPTLTRRGRRSILRGQSVGSFGKRWGSRHHEPQWRPHHNNCRSPSVNCWTNSGLP